MESILFWILIVVFSARAVATDVPVLLLNQPIVFAESGKRALLIGSQRVLLFVNQSECVVYSLIRAQQQLHSSYKISRIWCTAYPTTLLNFLKWFAACWLFSRWAAMMHTRVSESSTIHFCLISLVLSLFLCACLCCRLKLRGLGKNYLNLVQFGGYLVYCWGRQ